MFQFYYYNYYLLEMPLFHLSTAVNFVGMQQYKVCLSFCLNICLSINQVKIDQFEQIGYVLAVTNLSLYKKNCDCMLDTFYRDTTKS